jgi:hypothetical protein
MREIALSLSGHCTNDDWLTTGPAFNSLRFYNSHPRTFRCNLIPLAYGEKRGTLVQVLRGPLGSEGGQPVEALGDKAWGHNETS